MEINEITSDVIGAAMKVHTALGLGLLERPYEICLLHELRKRGLKAESQVELPVIYDSVRMEIGYRLDLVVEDLVIVERKAAEAITPVYEAHLLSYLELSGKPVGLLINFHVKHLRDGIKRFVEGIRRGWEKPLRASVPSVVKN